MAGFVSFRPESLLRSDLGEEERQVLGHGVRLVGRGEEAVRLQAAVRAILLHFQHLVLEHDRTRHSRSWLEIRETAIEQQCMLCETM